MDYQIAVIHAFQVSCPGLGGLMQAAAFLGQPEFYLLVIPLILWCYDRSLGLRLLIFLSVSGAISDSLKILFHAPRPYWISPEVTAYTGMVSFGMPSGHAQNSVVLFGAIAATVRKWWIWFACIILILMIGMARVYQAVHFPLDIIAGWGIGVLLLAGLLYLEKPILQRVHGRSFLVQILLAFGLSLLFIGITGAAHQVIGSWQVPAEWSLQALARTGVPIDPLALKDTFVTAGLIFGGLSGALVSVRRFPFSTGSSPGRMAARYIVGIAILFVIWGALAVAAAWPGTGGCLMSYLRAVLAGFWITAGAPALFIRTGLARLTYQDEAIAPVTRMI